MTYGFKAFKSRPGVLLKYDLSYEQPVTVCVMGKTEEMSLESALSFLQRNDPHDIDFLLQSLLEEGVCQWIDEVVVHRPFSNMHPLSAHIPSMSPTIAVRTATVGFI